MRGIQFPGLYRSTGKNHRVRNPNQALAAGQIMDKTEIQEPEETRRRVSLIRKPGKYS